MSKTKTKQSKSATTEVVHAGQPSPALMAKLKSAGERLTDKQVTEAIRHAEQGRVTYQKNAVATGVILLAKRQTFAHGAWRKYLKDQICSAANLPSLRSLDLYLHLAKHFLADLEQGNFQPEEQDQKVTPPAIQPEEVLALDKLHPQRQGLVLQEIERFIAGRSLRRMLIDFRRAENAADQEEAEEADRKKKKKVTTTDAGQMDFFSDMMRPLGEIDTLFETPSFVERTDKKFWISVAEKLETQAQKARQMAKEIAS